MTTRGWLVPDDWNGEDYRYWMLCAPCSPQWDAIVQGSVYNLSRARNWDANSGDFLGARDLGKEVFLSMSNCNDGFMALANAVLELAKAYSTGQNDCGCPGGTGTVYDEEGGTAPTTFGPGEQWNTEQDYLDDKCHMANVMYRDYLALVQELNTLDIDTLSTGLASLGIGIVASVVAAFFATGPIGVTIGVVAGLVSLFVGAPLFSLGDVITELQNNKDDLVCALYNASDAASAKSGFEDILSAGPLSILETSFISLIGVNAFYNQLFDPPAGFDNEVVATPVDCATCNAGPAVRFMKALNGIDDRGSGDLTPDGLTRTLSSFQDTNGFHYLSFGIYAEGDEALSYNGTCNSPPLPAGLSGSGEETFRIRRVSDTRGTDSGTKGISCINAQYVEEFTANGNFGYGNDFNITWVQLISNTAFTFDLQIQYPDAI